MRTGCRWHDGWILQMKRLLQRLEGVWRHRSEYPAAIWLCCHPVGAARINTPAISLCLSAEQTDHQRRDISHRFAIAWHEGIQVDQVSNALGHLIYHTGDNHRAITMTHQDHSVQILFLQQADDILDMGV